MIFLFALKIVASVLILQTSCVNRNEKTFIQNLARTNTRKSGVLFFFFTFLEVCYFFLNLFREIYFASTSPYYMYHSEVNHWFDHIRLLRTVSEKSNLNIIKAWRPRLHNYFYLFNELNAACRSLGIQSSCFACLSMSKHVILCKRYIYHYFSTAAEIDLTIDWSLK